MTRRRKIEYVDMDLKVPFDLRSDVSKIAKEKGKTRNDVLRIWIETGVLSEKKMNRR